MDVVDAEPAAVRRHARGSAVAAPIQIILAENVSLIRAGTKGLLDTMRRPAAKVIAEAKNGAELLQLAAALQADLVVMDLAMPDMDAIAAIIQIKRARPEIKILVLATDTGSEELRGAFEAGVQGIVSKHEPAHQLEYAIERITLHDAQYFGHDVHAKILAPRDPTAMDLLTQRQLEILRYIAQGYASKQIAAELHLSAKTVDVHRQRIMQRLNIWEVANLTRYAIRKRLVSV